LSIDIHSSNPYGICTTFGNTKNREKGKEEIREGRKVKDRKEIGWDHFRENCY
jgi:hypothetical protein